MEASKRKVPRIQEESARQRGPEIKEMRNQQIQGLLLPSVQVLYATQRLRFSAFVTSNVVTNLGCHVRRRRLCAARSLCVRWQAIRCRILIKFIDEALSTK